jgi:hypothetical protein
LIRSILANPGRAGKFDWYCVGQNAHLQVNQGTVIETEKSWQQPATSVMRHNVLPFFDPKLFNDNLDDPTLVAVNSLFICRQGTIPTEVGSS